MRTPALPSLSVAIVTLLLTGPARADQVIADDLIVQGSQCVGFDCVNGESFGFATMILKENNVRLKFDDTSTSAGFPSNDWQITINDSASGGDSYFAIEDITGAKVPFKIMAGAPTNSLRVSSEGRLGIRTAAPQQDVHVAAESSPGIRLEQTTAGGSAAYSWDIVGNDQNFFVRDSTGGSNLPFRVRAGAPEDSLVVAADGSIGVGTATPSAALHVRRQDGNAQIRVEEAAATTATRTLLSFSNNGDIVTRYTVAPATAWESVAAAGTYQLRRQGAATAQLSLSTAGDLVITGSLSQGSSRALKTDIAPVNGGELLDKVMTLPIYSWRYKASSPRDRHMGPMAEDFHRIFGTGSDPARLAPGDMAGVALGAVQALSARVAEKDSLIASIRSRIEAIEARLGRGR